MKKSKLIAKIFLYLFIAFLIGYIIQKTYNGVKFTYIKKNRIVFKNPVSVSNIVIMEKYDYNHLQLTVITKPCATCKRLIIF